MEKSYATGILANAYWQEVAVGVAVVVAVAIDATLSNRRKA